MNHGESGSVIRGPISRPSADPHQTVLKPKLRVAAAAIYLGVLLLVLGRDLYSLYIHSFANALHSHIVLIPFISAYLIWIERRKLPRDYAFSFLPASLVGGAGVAVLVTARFLRDSQQLAENDYLSCIALCTVLLLVAGGFLFLGARWMKAAAFPVGFLVFSIPLPDAAAEYLETASKVGSAAVADLFFNISGTPFVRDGFIFQLPNIAIEVARECSGIRSSWVLLITSVLASYLFLNSRWRRSALIFAVIPLGLLRNGFRILVIGLLCVWVGPEMIDSPIHHRGGPIFFVLSLLPLFLLLGWLRKSDSDSRSSRQSNDSSAATER